MKALQYTRIGSEPELMEIDKPEPGPGEVLLEITAAGVCHSDELLMGLPAEQYPFGLPLTLGHEGAGRVAALGEGVKGLDIGTNVVVYGAWGCGQCWHCAQGSENYCSRAAQLGIVPPGLGAPGALAEFMIVDSPRHLVPIGDLDPVTAVPLTDAGLTPYHAIKHSLPKLGAGATVVVIGAGGLGHIAIQLLRHMTSARIIALDITRAKLKLAEHVGAHETVVSDGDAVANIRKITGDKGAQVVLDCVGYQSTIDISMAVAGLGADVTIVGLGDGQGAASVGFFRQPYEVSVQVPYWGSRTELIELIELAQQGIFDVAVETFSLDNGAEAYRRLAANTLTGRAVVVPGL